VHDAIAIKLNYTKDASIPTEMTAWYYCTDKRTDSGTLNPVMYEFGTINREGIPINIRRGQCVIQILLECIYHRMPNDFVIPSSPLSNPIFLDLYD
ncbi:22240_t:CDS:2, partial [Racocetra persica]